MGELVKNDRNLVLQKKRDFCVQIIIYEDKINLYKSSVFEIILVL